MDNRLDDAARALAERLPGLDASLDDRVMARIRTRTVDSRQSAVDSMPAVDRRLSTIRSWFEPRPIRMRPVWIPLALAAVLVLWLAPRRTASLPTATPLVATADTVYVRFQIAAPLARNVAVAGSFNGWSAAELPLRRTADGSWEATIALPVGEHRYQFVVDGQRWIPDPSAQAQVDDGFGGTNSVIVVGPKGVVRS